MFSRKIGLYPAIPKIIQTISANLSPEMKEARYLAFRLQAPDGIFSTTFSKGKPGPYSLVEIGSRKEGGHFDVFFQSETGRSVIIGATDGRYGCLPLIINSFLEQLPNPAIMGNSIITSSLHISAKPAPYLKALFKNSPNSPQKSFAIGS